MVEGKKRYFHQIKQTHTHVDRKSTIVIQTINSLCISDTICVWILSFFNQTCRHSIADAAIDSEHANQ